MPFFLELPTELTVLALRVALLLVLYGFIGLVLRGIWSDMRRPAVSDRAAAVRLRAESGPEQSLPAGTELILDPVTTLGRDTASTIRINDEHVSTQHAEIRRRGSRWVLRDLGSTNGTAVNGTLVKGERVLVDGDMIALGATSLRFCAT
jgi:hypothetical protein